MSYIGRGPWHDAWWDSHVHILFSSKYSNAITVIRFIIRHRMEFFVIIQLRLVSPLQNSIKTGSGGICVVQSSRMHYRLFVYIWRLCFQKYYSMGYIVLIHALYTRFRCQSLHMYHDYAMYIYRYAYVLMCTHCVSVYITVSWPGTVPHTLRRQHHGGSPGR